MNVVAAEEARHIVITHGTDTMVKTAKKLKGFKTRSSCSPGAMQPALFKSTDAEFNIGAAVAAVQLLPDGVYIVMNGRVLDPGKVKKNRKLHRFEEGSADTHHHPGHLLCHCLLGCGNAGAPDERYHKREHKKGLYLRAAPCPGASFCLSLRWWSCSCSAWPLFSNRNGSLRQ